ncbi:helix-turn-helix transcriptional regulator [Streptomyces diacarni]|uniref:XRE family transcriptional regulator n=1 Tax=Streptomyces diacarni TaxID=2800381 RepID=A0A367F6Z9_9ACTN|nr:helix-turn-helix transcriptional regulator [Streptomyces diacarni]RCG25632.1 XRE family transcriptional regulator [Streptomyces diacarni]
MPGPKDIDGSVGVPTFYGAELRWQREQAGMTQQQLVEGSFYGYSHLSEIERGERRMPLDLAEHVDRALKTDGFFTRRCEDVRRARRRGHAPYFEQVLEVETKALSIEEWSSVLLPGVLQTEAYARAVVEATHPLESPDEVATKVNGRLSRARLLDGAPKQPLFWVIMHENVIRQPLLGAAEMAEQLAHIADSAQRRRIVPQVVPGNAGPHPFLTGMTAIMTFADAPALVYTEGLHSGEVIDDPALVAEYRRSYDLLRAFALSPGASLAMILSAAEDYRNGTQPPWLERG